MFKATIMSAILGISPVFIALAETTTGEKVGEAMEDTAKGAKKMGRAASDKACEMINGKLECAGKKLVHKAKNAKDEIKDKADDVQKKVN